MQPGAQDRIHKAAPTCCDFDPIGASRTLAEQPHAPLLVLGLRDNCAIDLMRQRDDASVALQVVVQGRLDGGLVAALRNTTRSFARGAEKRDRARERCPQVLDAERRCVLGHDRDMVPGVCSAFERHAPDDFADAVIGFRCARAP